MKVIPQTERINPSYPPFSSFDFLMKTVAFVLAPCLLFSAFAQSSPSAGKMSDNPVSTQTTDLATQVIAPDWGSLKPSPLTGEWERGVQGMLLNANKFALNTWYHDRKGFDKQDSPYLDFKGRAEAQIRPVAHQVFGLATSLKWNIYDPAITEISREEATRRTIRMISSLAHHHKANQGKTGWGDAWQSALWASQAALAGWFLWDELDASTRMELTRMTEHEADRFINYKTPYYRNKTGKIITPGDSKAEENAWNSTILVAANVMMPHHPNWQRWNDKAIELQASAYSAPGDWNLPGSINGFPFSKLNGSNIDPDGTVINHNILHPDYMTAIMGSATNAWIYCIGGMKSPKASLFNGNRVYHALTDLLVKDGKTMYVSNQGQATATMYYPQGNDWGNNRQANYWLMDIMADLFHWDTQSSIKGHDWARARQQEMQAMQARTTTGQYYQKRDEDTFPSREEWISYHLAFGYIGLWLHQNKLVEFTDEPLKAPVAR